MAEVLHAYDEQTTLQEHTGSTASITVCDVVGATDITWKPSTDYLIVAKGVLGGSSAADLFDLDVYVSTVVFTDYPSGPGVLAGSEMTIEPTYVTQGEGCGYLYVYKRQELPM